MAMLGFVDASRRGGSSLRQCHSSGLESQCPVTIGIIACCVRCKDKKIMADARYITMNNGKRPGGALPRGSNGTADRSCTGRDEKTSSPAGPSLNRQRLALCSDQAILDRRETVSRRLTCDNEPSRKPIKPSALTAIWIELRSFPILQGGLNYR
jgi:hypothetical protein